MEKAAELKEALALVKDAEENKGFVSGADNPLAEGGVGGAGTGAGAGAGAGAAAGGSAGVGTDVGASAGSQTLPFSCSVLVNLFEHISQYPPLQMTSQHMGGDTSDAQDGLRAVLLRVHESDAFARASMWVARLAVLADTVIHQCLNVWGNVRASMRNQRTTVELCMAACRRARVSLLDECARLVSATLQEPADASTVGSASESLMSRIHHVQKELNTAQDLVAGMSPGSSRVITGIRSHVAQVVLHATNHVLSRHTVETDRVRQQLRTSRQLAAQVLGQPVNDMSSMQNTSGIPESSDRPDDIQELRRFQQRTSTWAMALLQITSHALLGQHGNVYQLLDDTDNELARLGEFAAAASECVDSFVSKFVAPLVQSDSTPSPIVTLLGSHTAGSDTLTETRGASGSRCFNCGGDNPGFTCSSCRSVRFCSQDCQRHAWRSHRQMCVLAKAPAPATRTPTSRQQVRGRGHWCRPRQPHQQALPSGLVVPNELLFLSVIKHLVKLGSVDLVASSANDLLECFAQGADGHELVTSLAFTIDLMIDVWQYHRSRNAQVQPATAGPRASLATLLRAHVSLLHREAAAMCVRKVAAAFHHQLRDVVDTATKALGVVPDGSCSGGFRGWSLPTLAATHAGDGSGAGSAVVVPANEYSHQQTSMQVEPCWSNLTLASCSNRGEPLQARLQAEASCLHGRVVLPTTAIRAWFGTFSIAAQLIPEAISGIQRKMWLLLECLPMSAYKPSLAQAMVKLAEQAGASLNSPLSTLRSSEGLAVPCSVIDSVSCMEEQLAMRRISEACWASVHKEWQHVEHSWADLTAPASATASTQAGFAESGWANSIEQLQDLISAWKEEGQQYLRRRAERRQRDAAAQAAQHQDVRDRQEAQWRQQQTTYDEAMQNATDSCDRALAMARQWSLAGEHPATVESAVRGRQLVCTCPRPPPGALTSFGPYVLQLRTLRELCAVHASKWWRKLNFDVLCKPYFTHKRVYRLVALYNTEKGRALHEKRVRGALVCCS